MSADDYRSGPATGAEVRQLAAVLERRFSHPAEGVVPIRRLRDKAGRFVRSEFGPIAAGIVTARDLVEPTGIRATLHRHFTWDLDEPLPIFREALAAVEGGTS